MLLFRSGKINQVSKKGLQAKFCNAEQDCFGAPGQAKNSLRISVENTAPVPSKKKKDKINNTSMAKDMWPFRYSQAPSFKLKKGTKDGIVNLTSFTKAKQVNLGTVS